MAGQVTRQTLKDQGITDVDQQNAVLDAQATKNEAMAVYYETLKGCIEDLRSAEKLILKGWIGYDIGFRKFLDLSFMPNLERYKDSELSFNYRFQRHPETLWADEGGSSANANHQNSALVQMARNMHTIGANFGLPLQILPGNWPANKEYSLGYGVAEADLTTSGKFHGIIAGDHLGAGSIAGKMKFHHYMFTDKGDGGNSVDWAKTAQKKYSVGDYYIGTDEQKEKFISPQDGDGSVVDSFIGTATSQFPYIYAYSQQYANREGIPAPWEISQLQSQTTTWHQDVKWSFASNNASFADANIGDDEWVMGDIHQQAIDEALEDATNADGRQQKYMQGLSSDQKLALGITSELVKGWEFESDAGDTGGWLHAPHSIQHHGTFEQIWKEFSGKIASTHIDSTRAAEYREAIAGPMTLGATNLINGIVQFASAWACIRTAVMLYLGVLAATRAAIKEAFKDASGFWAKAAGILGGPFVDSISNTGIMNDLMFALGAQSASDSIGSAVQRNIFKEQCFLLSYIEQLAKIKRERDYNGGIAANAPFVGGTNNSNGEPKKAVPYVNNSPNSTLLIDGDPYAFLNKLTQSEGGRIFFNTDTEVLDHLQPMIRLFKVSYDDDGAASEDEFIFESSASGLVSMLQDRRRRGAGVGIKSFDFAFEGSNPFAVKKSISATLKVFASSMDELLLPRRNQAGNLISFADLALKTRNPPPSRGPTAPGALPASCQPGTPGAATAGGAGGILAAQNANLDKLTFRLKAVVGWATPNGNGPWTKMSSLGSRAQTGKELLYKGIWNSTITLNLTPTVHHFEFDELGRTTMVIKYLAYVEDFYDQPAFNIFATPGSDSPTAKQIVRNLQLKYYTRVCESTELENVKKNLAEKANEEKKTIMQSLVTNLAKQRKIYYLQLPIENIGFFNSEGPYYDWSVNASPLAPTTDSSKAGDQAAYMNAAIEQYKGFSGADEAEETHLFRSGLEATNPNSENLPFVYVSDLVDCIMANIEAELVGLPDQVAAGIATAEGLSQDACMIELEKQKLRRLQVSYRKLRIVLGPLEIVNQAKGAASTLHCTFGDVPISMKYLLEWIANELTQTAQTIYTLTRFLNDLFNKLISDFLNDGSCFNWNIKPGGKIRMNQTVITSYPLPGPNDEVSTVMEETGKPRAHISTLPRPVFNISGVPDTPIAAGSVADEMNYFIYFAGRVAPVEHMNGDKETDEQAGIYHYLAGRNRGLIKNIKFNKTDSPGLAEVRFEQDGYEGLQQLRVLYDVDIEMYANVKTFPGTYIFVDPRGLAPSTNLTPRDPLNLTQYGIGGYMMIIKSEHSFAPGKAESRLHAKWVNGINDSTGADSPLLEDSTQVATPGGSNSRCEGNLTSRADSANQIP